MKRYALLIAGGTLLVVACATTKTMNAVTGSRADGTVQLAFEYGMFENPKVDMAASLQTAQARCGAWGYSGAEPFGAALTQCVAANGYGCVRSRVTVEYQCTSGGSTPAVAAIQSTPDTVVAPMPAPSMGSSAKPGTIDLGGGVMLVPAKTLSGYCIKAPVGYVGTGSVNRPTASNARPICA